MAFTRVKPTGWAIGEKWRSTQANSLDLDHSRALDAYNGGDHMPVTRVDVLGNEGMYIHALQSPRLDHMAMQTWTSFTLEKDAGDWDTTNIDGEAANVVNFGFCGTHFADNVATGIVSRQLATLQVDSLGFNLRIGNLVGAFYVPDVSGIITAENALTTTNKRWHMIGDYPDKIVVAAYGEDAVWHVAASAIDTSFTFTKVNDVFGSGKGCALLHAQYGAATPRIFGGVVDGSANTARIRYSDDGGATWSTSTASSSGNNLDNHNPVCMADNGSGTVIVAFAGTDGYINYSTTNGAASSWTAEEIAVAYGVTQPYAVAWVPYEEVFIISGTGGCVVGTPGNWTAKNGAMLPDTGQVTGFKAAGCGAVYAYLAYVADASVNKIYYGVSYTVDLGDTWRFVPVGAVGGALAPSLYKLDVINGRFVVASGRSATNSLGNQMCVSGMVSAPAADVTLT